MHPYLRWRALTFSIGLLAAVGTVIGLLSLLAQVLWLLAQVLLGAF